ncbi:MAG: diguanylate cyclase domain [Acidimicrobiales bacterium]|nr:diguanylate cyclase domain [Acidimicrobiales bacterium]
MTTTDEGAVARDVPDAGSEIFCLLDADARVLHVSEQTKLLLGTTDDAVMGESGFRNIHPADLDRAMDAFAAATAAPDERVELRVRARPLVGAWRELDLTVVNLLHDPAVRAIVISGDDVTAQRRAAVAGSLETRLLDSLPTAVVVTDDASVVVLWNRRATELYGYQPEEALGHDINELTIAAPSELRTSILATVAEDGRWSGEFVTSRKDGTAIPILATLEKLDAPEIGFHGLVGASMDNSERRALQVTLAHQALHDPLTGLPNRALFLDRLDRALTRLRRHPGTIAVLFVDLDRFKIVNDTYGHHAGDEILQAVGSLFEGVLRSEDTVARMGGDEFAVCCEQLTGPAEAVALAERLTASVSHPFLVAGRAFYVTPSVGIVLGTGVPGETASTLLRDADAAMYHAKDRGRGRIELFDHGMRSEALRKAQVASELRHALDRGELVLHYQPIVRLSDGALTGFEALLRWDHPELGMLLPSSFMDVAEDTFLIVPIGAWVLDEAGRQLAAWRDELPEHPITISVNLSARQIADPHLVATVGETLARHQLEPSRLSLEITESTLMEDAEVSLATLRELKALGVQLAIDDFGTGHSSLAYLKRFPVDFLKIDRSFVAGLDRESEDAVIVKAVVDLGRALGLVVVAEGVETDGQLAELERIGCELAQGYRWSMPCPPGDAVQLASGWAPTTATHPVAAALAQAEEPAVLSTGEVLSVLTHELVTPLTVVKGQCERLATLVADIPKAAEVVAAVARNAERIEHLVATLADAQQLDAGTVSLRVTPFDLVELVEDVVHLAVPEDRVVELAGAAAVHVEADGRRVEQIIVNLLTNAHKFSPPGTPIVVWFEADEDEVTVIVADEGPGVAPERAGDIFRKFARLERNKKGVGLGLFISRRLARAHGGDLHYRRRRPQGSELVLTLPRRTSP